MTYEEARKEAEQILKGAEVPDAALDAWYLLEYAIRKIEKKETGRTWYLMNRKESILPGTLLYYQELVSRRKQQDSAAASDRRTGVLRLSILCQ